MTGVRLWPALLIGESACVMIAFKPFNIITDGSQGWGNQKVFRKPFLVGPPLDLSAMMSNGSLPQKFLTSVEITAWIGRQLEIGRGE
ncbi:hypothetical protein F5148DRAFT_1253913 [Russula earlei]|uniref:Uncharacterized protein n=1 Tax=Russula earlei TaxID=71964 RepID=A0ACC0TTZ5_9AGAM|nr:hypothetical protein F5148DRAFT_1253913 [Russula earlei]